MFQEVLKRTTQSGSKWVLVLCRGSGGLSIGGACIEHGNFDAILEENEEKLGKMDVRNEFVLSGFAVM